MPCVPDPIDPRTPCTACPSPAGVGFISKGQFTPSTTAILNTNFEIVQCLADLCGLSGGGTPSIGLTVLDSTCKDMGLTGTGTLGDPWVISASPILAPSQGSVDNAVKCLAGQGLFVGQASLLDNNNGTFTYTDSLGTETILSICSMVSFCSVGVNSDVDTA